MCVDRMISAVQAHPAVKKVDGRPSRQSGAPVKAHREKANATRRPGVQPMAWALVQNAVAAARRPCQS